MSNTETQIMKMYPRNAGEFGYLFSTWVRKFWDCDGSSVLYQLIHMDEFKPFWREFCMIMASELRLLGETTQDEVVNLIVQSFGNRCGGRSEYDTVRGNYYNRMGGGSYPSRDGPYYLTGTNDLLMNIWHVGLRLMSDESLEAFAKDLFQSCFFQEGHEELTTLSWDEYISEILRLRKEGWEDFNEIFKELGVEESDRKLLKASYIRKLERDSDDRQ